MRESCINHPADEPLAMVRRWQREFCAFERKIGDRTIQDYHIVAAALLSFFEYWHNIKKAILDEKIRLGIFHKKPYIPSLKDYLQFHTQEELVAGIEHIGKKDSVIDAKKMLIAKGVITEHANPLKQHGYDKTIYYQFHPEVLNDWLAIRKITLSEIRQREIDAQNNNLPSSENRQALSEHRQASANLRQASSEVRQTITEITTEIPLEISKEEKREEQREEKNAPLPLSSTLPEKIEIPLNTDSEKNKEKSSAKKESCGAIENSTPEKIDATEAYIQSKQPDWDKANRSRAEKEKVLAQETADETMARIKLEMEERKIQSVGVPDLERQFSFPVNATEWFRKSSLAFIAIRRAPKDDVPQHYPHAQAQALIDNMERYAQEYALLLPNGKLESYDYVGYILDLCNNSQRHWSPTPKIFKDRLNEFINRKKIAITDEKPRKTASDVRAFGKEGVLQNTDDIQENFRRKREERLQRERNGENANGDEVSFTPCIEVE